MAEKSTKKDVPLKTHKAQGSTQTHELVNLTRKYLNSRLLQPKQDFKTITGGHNCEVQCGVELCVDLLRPMSTTQLAALTRLVDKQLRVIDIE